MKFRQTLYLFGMLLVLAACAQLGLQSPRTVEDRVLAGYSTAKVMNQTATRLLNAKKISSSDAQHVLNTTRTIREGLDVARVLMKVDPKAAEAKVVAQEAMIKVLEDYLAKKGG